MESESRYIFIADWLKRVKRLTIHFQYPFYRKRKNTFPPSGVLEWVLDLPFYILDVILIPEIYQTILRVCFKRIRPLNPQEQLLASSIFEKNIHYGRIFINSKAKIIAPKYALAYVTFNIIHYKDEITPATLIHELTHIWQYQQFGSIYIARAIKAQKSQQGYDYGGIEGLYHAIQTGKLLTDFNFEQQADIIEDYYLHSIEGQQSSAMQAMVYQYYHQHLDV
ncbi:MAG: hypothetical protein LC107_04095 [Chitinophagales bacterium]|nr:hypothetical protein [Chitinophagales bacterium]